MPRREQPNNLSEAIRYAVDNILMGLWTACPGIIESYDQSTHRASIMPTPQYRDVEGNMYDHPVLPDIPVIFNSGGGYTVSAPLKRGDSVLLVFCRRGIQNFKQVLANTQPSGGMMDIDSAIAIPGFGGSSFGSSEGISLQKNDGSVKLEVLTDSVVATTTGGSMTLGSDGIVRAKDFITGSGVSLNDHPHDQGADSDGNSEQATESPTATDI